MTVTVALMNSKGGVGKTTATIYLATALAQRGLTVEVWDADPQGSASEWVAAAEETGPAPFDLIAVNAASLRRQRSRTDLVLIDTPPGEASLQNAVLARADLVIVPTAPSWPDMQRVWVTLDALGEKPHIVLLNRVNRRTRTYAEAREALDGVPTFDASVSAREAYKTAAGTIPSSLREWGDVARELIQLTKEN